LAALHKTCWWSTARELSLPWWRDWASPHQQTSPRDSPSPVWGPDFTRCPGVRAEMSEGQDGIPYALTSVPSAPRPV